MSEEVIYESTSGPTGSWPELHRTIVPTPRPGLVVIGGANPGLKPGAIIRAPFRGWDPRL